MILDSFFRIPGIVPASNEVGILHDIYRFYDPSQTAILFRGTLIPAFLTLFAWITPAGAARPLRLTDADPAAGASGSRLRRRDLALLLAGPAPRRGARPAGRAPRPR